MLNNFFRNENGQCYWHHCEVGPNGSLEQKHCSRKCVSMNVNTYYNLCHSATGLRWLTDLITRSACLQSQTDQHIPAGDT